MIKKQIAITLCLLGLITTQTVAQDHIYSQFYNAPAYLNPALNGQFEGDFRFNSIYRSQWTNVSGPLTYYSVSADINIARFNGGFGVLISKSSEGTAYLNKLNFSAIYSYSATFNNAVLSFGIQGGLTNRRLDASKLVYFDQLSESGIIPGGPTTADNLAFNKKYFFDSGAGINLVLGNFMIGSSAQHLNKPDESLTGSKSILPTRINGYMSYKIFLDPYDEEDGPSIIPSIVYYDQAKTRSASAGVQLKSKAINIGAWYRGQGKDNDAIVVSLILDLFVKKDYYDKVRFGVSHDATTSKLNYGKTAGTTEGALSYETTLFPNSNTFGRGFDGTGNGKRCYDFY